MGVDLGIIRLITVSDGTFIDNPRALSRYERKLKRLQKSAARKMLGSQNQAKVNRKIAKYNARISNIRKDALHRATTMLTRTKSAIGVEALSIRAMVQNHYLAGCIEDASFGECVRQMGYKVEWYGSKLVLANRSYPSTRRCCRCGWINPKLPLSQRVFRCQGCGLVMDRDLNAARNNHPDVLVAASWAETVNARESREVTAPAMLEAVPGGEAGTERDQSGCPDHS